MRLIKSGFSVLPVDDVCLPVLCDCGPLCRVSEKGTVFYSQSDCDAPEKMRQIDTVTRQAAVVREYMQNFDTAHAMKLPHLEGNYKLLADYNGTCLAARESEHGMQFVTWNWDYDRNGVNTGHYFSNSYEQAKQDFAIRCGLVDRHALFDRDQMKAIYRSMSAKNIIVDNLKKAMEHELQPIEGQGLSLSDIERKLAQLETEFQKALEAASECGDQEAYMDKFTSIMDEQSHLKAERVNILQRLSESEGERSRGENNIELLKNISPEIREWDESIIRQIIETVKVESADDITVYFKDGAEMRQKLSTEYVR